MNPLARRLLEAFDELGRDALELAALAERAALSASGPTRADREAVGVLAAEMVRRGWLRPAGSGDLFARTEDGRLALAGPRDVTLYTRPGCHLCEEAKAQMAPLLSEFGAKLREINIDADAVLRERYTDGVPVIFLGSRKVAKYRVNLDRLRRQLAQSLR